MNDCERFGAHWCAAIRSKAERQYRTPTVPHSPSVPHQKHRRIAAARPPRNASAYLKGTRSAHAHHTHTHTRRIEAHVGWSGRRLTLFPLSRPNAVATVGRYVARYMPHGVAFECRRQCNSMHRVRMRTSPTAVLPALRHEPRRATQPEGHCSLTGQCSAVHARTRGAQGSLRVAFFTPTQRPSSPACDASRCMRCNRHMCRVYEYSLPCNILLHDHLLRHEHRRQQRQVERRVGPCACHAAWCPL